MARGNARYLWGRTLVGKIIVKQWIDWDLQASAPDMNQGRMYVDASGNIKFNADGSNWSTVTVS
jgi:hypothetical protein